MSLDIALKAKELVQRVDALNTQVVAAVGGNNSANKRARKLSVELRKEFKDLRVSLLKMEKGR